MFRRILFTGLLFTAFLLTDRNLSACGDKFLVLGRSVGYQSLLKASKPAISTGLACCKEGRCLSPQADAAHLISDAKGTSSSMSRQTLPTCIPTTVRFLKSGRYLVHCMNRVHFLNDWMFGFVNVVGE